jgi:Sulfotransferase domain
MITLEKLGFAPCYHMRDLLGDLEHGLPLWEAVAAGNPDWEAIFGDAQSTCDFPSARFYKELAEVYPDAKVILTVRDAQGWVKSMRETVWGIFAPDTMIHHLSEGQALIDPLWRRYIELMGNMNWDDSTGAIAPFRETLTDEGLAASMERWNDEVKRTIPAERLLVWDPQEGWEPLCRFLDVDVPHEPLPRTNDTSAFKEGVLGGALAAINEWWDARERPGESLHGAALQPS